MKENILKGVLSASVAALSAYFGQMLIPLAVLIAVMIIDYVSGMTKAYITAELSSKKGLRGILKKLSYLLVVSVGMACDWIISAGLSQIGVEIPSAYLFALMIIIWLIINELLSIIENISAIGVPVPAFLTRLIARLKNTVENTAVPPAAEDDESQKGDS